MTPQQEQEKREFNGLLREAEFQLTEYKMHREDGFWKLVRAAQERHIWKLKTLAALYRPEWK